MVPRQFEKPHLMLHKASIEMQDLAEERFELDDDEMKEFIKRGKAKKMISEQPKRQQLYFLYKLIVNRTKIEYSLKDYFRYLLGKLVCCSKSFKKSNRY